MISLLKADRGLRAWFTIGQWKKAMKELWFIVIRPIAFVYCGVEYLFLIACQARALRGAEYVYPLWFWSFGHQAADLHMLSMRFRGKKILVLLSDYQNFNPHIINSFREHIDICFLRHSLCMRKACTLLKVLKVRRLKFALLRLYLCVIRSKAVLLPEYYESEGSALEGVFLTERLRLFQENADMNIVPSPEPIERFHKILTETYPSLSDKWFVSLYFRSKIPDVVDFRDTDPAPYKVVVERIGELGGFVFCGGDCDPHQLFPDMPNVLGYKDFSCDRSLTDFYFLTQCRFLIGAPSGPVAIAISFHIPTLISSTATYYYSGARENQIVLYKKLQDSKTGRVLSAHEIFSLPIVAFRNGREFQRAGLLHIDNTREEIADALEEMIQRYIMGKEIVLPEHQFLYDRFRHLLPKESVAFQTPSRPALSYLQNIVW